MCVKAFHLDPSTTEVSGFQVGELSVEVLVYSHACLYHSSNTSKLEHRLCDQKYIGGETEREVGQGCCTIFNIIFKMFNTFLKIKYGNTISDKNEYKPMCH